MSAELRLRRGPPSVWARVSGYILLYGLMWPIVKLMELAGRWPRSVSRGMARMMDRHERYEPDAHDVLVCSYFKSGTNWMMQIAVQIAHRGGAEFEHIHDIVPWLELPARNRYTVPLTDDTARRNAPTGLRVVKTHLPFSKLGYTPQARYIWVVRDPKDVFVSSYHFIRSIMLGPLMPSVQRWLDLYLSADTFVGSWAEHLAGGWQRRHLDNVLFLTFEEMKADLPATVRRIAELMGVQLTPEELDRVVHRASYEHMKRIGHKFDTAGLSPPWAKFRGAMVRRGERGSAGELLSPAEQRRIDEYWRAELARLGCDFPYDEIYGAGREAPAPDRPAETARRRSGHVTAAGG
jgi:hypothetical protein